MNAEITAPIKIWQPKDGESMIGQIVGTRIESGIYGENRQVLVKDKYGNVSAVWLTKRLKTKLKNQCADRGDIFTLTFVGKKPSPGGQYYTQGGSYNDYNLIVEKIQKDY
jgi:hypothetical protein